MRTRKQDLVSDELKPIVSKILKEYRLKYNYSFEDLSKALNHKKNRQTLHKYESGILNIPYELFFEICKVFNIESDVLKDIPLTEDVDPLVKDNEPHLALFGGEDGLKFYRQILKDAHKVVNEKNIIAFEHAYNHKEAMAELVKQHFPNSKFETLKDLNGKDRMTIIINN